MSTKTTERVIAHCSFCLEPNTSVKTLVSGPGVYICDRCVSACNEIIASKPVSVARLAPWELDLSLEKVLEALPPVAAAGAQLEAHLGEWVRRARGLGATWARIGEALGMTRQSAWERFSGEE